MTAPVPVPDGTTPPAEAVEAALSRHSHWGLSSSDQKPIQCICGQLLGSTADWRHHQAAAVLAALRLPERDRETAAKALDEAADAWSDWDALDAPEDWLRDRASAILGGPR
jgi:hypothetical protein